MGDSTCKTDEEDRTKIRVLGCGIPIGMLGRPYPLAEIIDSEPCQDVEAVSRLDIEDWRGNQRRHERMWRQKVTSASRRFQRRC